MLSNFEFGRLPAYAGIAGFVLWALIERGFHLSKQRQGEGEGRDQGTYWLISLTWYGATILSILDANYLQWTTVETPLRALRWLGIPLILIGLAARVMARRALGRHYSVQVKTSDAHALVTTGIYGLVRHPAYLGLLCLFLGIPLSSWSMMGLVIALFGGVPALVHRIRVEEDALSEWFGDAYLAYAEETWRLIPYVW